MAMEWEDSWRPRELQQCSTTAFPYCGITACTLLTYWVYYQCLGMVLWLCLSCVGATIDEMMVNITAVCMGTGFCDRFFQLVYESYTIRRDNFTDHWGISRVYYCYELLVIWVTECLTNILTSDIQTSLYPLFLQERWTCGACRTTQGQFRNPCVYIQIIELLTAYMVTVLAP